MKKLSIDILLLAVLALGLGTAALAANAQQQPTQYAP